MKAADETIRTFIDALSSGAPTPGGGGAAALCGALSSALSGMICALTCGKKRYADVEDDIQSILKLADALSKQFLDLIDEDAEAFAPLAAAYRMPKETIAQQTEKDAAMQAAVSGAVLPPLRIMHAAAESIELLSVLAEKGARIAVSDVGVGAELAKCALRSGYLNVVINTKSMADGEMRARINAEAEALLNEYEPKAEAVYRQVAKQLA